MSVWSGIILHLVEYFDVRGFLCCRIDFGREPNSPKRKFFLYVKRKWYGETASAGREIIEWGNCLE
jgi:hypothetical protein